MDAPRLAGRDRSGRDPRASRQYAFAQASSDWSVPGAPHEIAAPTPYPPNLSLPTPDERDINRQNGSAN